MKSRRQFIQNSTAGLGALSLHSLLSSAANKNIEKKKILCIGAHPDDPESGCGGTLAKLGKNGHAITIIYLTTGEAGIEGKSHAEASSIRKQEAIHACTILNAKPVFAGQTDGDTIMDNKWLSKIERLIYDEKPDIVLAHWPLDSHKDHQVAGLITIQSWVKTKRLFSLYFFEVCTGEQTMTFHPTDYIDITDIQAVKRKAVFCHVSQDPQSIYNCGHAAMEEFRGRELGVKAAEAFICMNGRKQSSSGKLNI